jgi:hypothetical protein
VGLTGLKQCINERGDTRAAQDYQQAEEKQAQNDGEQPPLFVVLEKVPEFRNESGPGLVGCDPFEFFLGFFLHGFADVNQC